MFGDALLDREWDERYSGNVQSPESIHSREIVGLTRFALIQADDNIYLCNATERDEYVENLSPERKAALERGEYGFMGLFARIEVLTQAPDNPGVIVRHPLESGGLWGIEDDSDSGYVAAIFRDEIESMLDDLRHCYNVPEYMIQAAWQETVTAYEGVLNVQYKD